MFKTTLTLVMAALCLNLSNKTAAQFYKPSGKTIRMGEPLPESCYQTIHHALNAKTGKVTVVQLKDYKNKLIILDFWATWCSPCIYSLKKLDSIQKQLNTKDYIVIPVTYQSAKEAAPVVHKYKWDMTSIIGDTILAQIFPHSGIPHQVWIRNGKVIAIPKWDYATPENISKTMRGEAVNWIMNSQDRIVDPYKLLFVAGNGDTGKYYSNKYAELVHYLPGFMPQTPTFLHSGDTSILYAVNQSITQLFYYAYRQQIFPAFDFKGSSASAIRWEISDKLRSRILEKPKQSLRGNYQQDSLYQKWIAKNSYGYRLRFPEKIKKSEALYFLQQDLNRFFGVYLNLHAEIETKIRHKYAVIRLKGTKQQAENLLGAARGSTVKSGPEGYKNYVNSYYRQLPVWLSKDIHKAVPGLTIGNLLDSTGIAGSFRISMSLSKSTGKGKLEIIQDELAKYGLRLSLEDKKVPVLVIREGNCISTPNN